MPRRSYSTVSVAVWTESVTQEDEPRGAQRLVSAPDRGAAFGLVRSIAMPS
jgi:hypothetical protein